MTVTKPNYIDVTSLIRHVRPETEQTRALSDITDQVCHYLAGPPQPANQTIEQVIATLQSLARFHQGRDFGGGSLGRTLEYTYAVDLAGRIYLVNRESLITWSHRNGNRVGMATVLLLGSGQEPSQAMLNTLFNHFDYTATRGDMRVSTRRSWAHGETSLIYGGGPAWGNNTDCCGWALPYVRVYRERAIMPPTPPNVRLFPETGQETHDAFKDAWEALERIPATDGVSGNLAMQMVGFPITAERRENLSGREYTVQYFQRSRAEWHDEETPGRVAWGLLGVEVEAHKDDAHHECACD